MNDNLHVKKLIKYEYYSMNRRRFLEKQNKSVFFSIIFSLRCLFLNGILTISDYLIPNPFF